MYDHSFGEIFDLRAIVKSGKGNHTYSCQRIIYEDGESEDWCSCVGWRTRFAPNRKTQSCTHFDEFELAIDKYLKEKYCK